MFAIYYGFTMDTTHEHVGKRKCSSVVVGAALIVDGNISCR